jgi:hypothetical protein
MGYWLGAFSIMAAVGGFLTASYLLAGLLGYLP